MRATLTGPKEAAVRPKTLPLDLFVGYLSGGGAANLPVDLRVGYFGRSSDARGLRRPIASAAAPWRKAPSRSTAMATRNRRRSRRPRPCPRTLGGDGTTKSVIEVPQGLDGATDMLVEMDYRGRQWRSADGVAPHPDLHLGGADRHQDRWLADEAGRSAPALRRARYLGQAASPTRRSRSRSTAARS